MEPSGIMIDSHLLVFVPLMMVPGDDLVLLGAGPGFLLLVTLTVMENFIGASLIFMIMGVLLFDGAETCCQLIQRELVVFVDALPDHGL